MVDTNVFGAELTRRGADVVEAYGRHIDGHDLVISFVTVAEGDAATVRQLPQPVQHPVLGKDPRPCDGGTIDVVLAHGITAMGAGAGDPQEAIAGLACGRPVLRDR